MPVITCCSPACCCRVSNLHRHWGTAVDALQVPLCLLPAQLHTALLPAFKLRYLPVHEGLCVRVIQASGKACSRAAASKQTCGESASRPPCWTSSCCWRSACLHAAGSRHGVRHIQVSAAALLRPGTCKGCPYGCKCKSDWHRLGWLQFGEQQNCFGCSPPWLARQHQRLQLIHLHRADDLWAASGDWDLMHGFFGVKSMPPCLAQPRQCQAPFGCTATGPSASGHSMDPFAFATEPREQLARGRAIAHVDLDAFYAQVRAAHVCSGNS